jgi:predicted Zn-dependent protease with MMP-like domain
MRGWPAHREASVPYARVDPDRFDQLVAEALEQLPESISQKLDNISIVVADWPTRADLAASGLPRGHTLFGLYQGVPHTRRTSHYGLVTPDRITVFSGPIMQACRTEEEMREEVRRVVLHEVGHHFGLSEARLDELGM